MRTTNLDVNVINFDDGQESLQANGFQIIKHNEWLIPSSVIRHWQALARTWDDLPVDPYMQGGATFRQRRFGRFVLDEATGSLQRSENNTFFQGKNINTYAGGINRVFEPMHDLTYRNRFLQYVIDTSLDHLRQTFSVTSRRWDITVHQFRILASSQQSGLPTPEGIHRDGHKFISMHLIAREAVMGGVSKIYSNDKREIAEVTLEKPMDSILMADEVVMHAVTPVLPVSPEKAGYRDVMVIDYNLLDE
ncbi:2OG-Fe dioxygenase family protein [Chitinivorax sp. B]|uniref:2OG-Fe dioxygenase family protein n=1 Tax=Chitinivorax sp. B TaxID=2502235 RepID=UPI0010F8592A|nr:2OG-Fe dioxygenase family protein [Chitinivorax sp. B]